MLWLSVVIPVRNEAAGITQALAPLQALRDRLELIVVDGGSSDNTAELARPLADQVLVAAPGRARQMNAGAAVARGEVLLFLHADTRLPEGFVALIEAVVFGQPAFAARPPLPPESNNTEPASNGTPTKTPPQPTTPNPTRGSGGLAAKAMSPDTRKPWGRFDVRLSPASPLLNLVAWMMNQRSRLTGICTGDQAIFVRRDLFEQLGGYSDIPLMEDIDLSRRLRKIASPACLRPALTTSSRKWHKHGVCRTIALMWWIRLQYWAGVSPERLVRQYYGAAANSPSRPLLIFAKAPVPGTVKTRLIPALGAEGACDLYRQLLTHTLEQTRDWPGPRLLYCAPDLSHPLFTQLATEHHLQLRQQHGDDLGARMSQALAEHPGGGLLIGTDCPLINTAVLLQADQALATHDTAILPSEDGGYVLIGQRQPDAAAFTDMRWSHSRVMADTRQRLAAAGKCLWEGPVLWDLDEPADLPRLADIKLAPR